MGSGVFLGIARASMRPSAFANGNSMFSNVSCGIFARFNEAVGFRQRKCDRRGVDSGDFFRASMRPSAFANGNMIEHAHPVDAITASMRPSAFANGNPTAVSKRRLKRCFNEAVGFRQRKYTAAPASRTRVIASMRPSAFANGN